MRSPIGSLRRRGGAGGVREAWAERAGVASAGLSAVLVSGGFGTGVTVEVGWLSAASGGTAVGLAKNGAGCGPDWRKTALTMMIKLAALAHRIAARSTGR